MSRLSKWLRRVRLGPIVDWAVRLAEKLLGAGTGDLKKALVAKLMEVIIEFLKKAGKEVPENADVLVDELTEQTVTLLNATGEFEKSEDAPNAQDMLRAEPAAKTAAPIKKGGRPKGSKNRPKPDVRGVGPVTLPEPMFEPEELPVIETDDDIDDIDLTEFDLDD